MSGFEPTDSSSQPAGDQAQSNQSYPMAWVDVNWPWLKKATGMSLTIAPDRNQNCWNDWSTWLTTQNVRWECLTRLC